MSMQSLHVEVSGTNDAASIVFLHGIGASGWMWQQQTAALADFHCLNVDLPGHGKSNQVEWRSLKDTADQVAAIIRERAARGRAHIVGLSLGGYVTLMLLEYHADVVDHAVISGVTVAPMPNREWLMPQVWLMSAFKSMGWLANMQARSMNVPDSMQAAFTENFRRMSMQAYRRIMEEAVEFRISPSLSQVNTPTLIVAGGRESQIILDAVDVIPKIMPNAQGRLAPGLRHGWNVEAPQLFNAMLRAWITDAPLPDKLQSI